MILSSLQKYGVLKVHNKLPIYWYSGQSNRNFGDVLGPYLAQKISGKESFLVSKKCISEHYLTVGSILWASNKHSIIWGSGIISKNHKIIRPKKILAVRGPKTRERLIELGIDCPSIYGDPALLLPRFYKPRVFKKKYKLGIILHYVDINNKIIKKIKHDGDIKIINILDPIEKVIDEIYNCSYTISSSLHGLITSHAYNIPSLLIKLSEKLDGDGIKFEDYFLSVGMTPYKPLILSDNLLNMNEIIKLINSKQQEINIDLDKLMNVCPFLDL